MLHTAEMVSTHPHAPGRRGMVEGIDACFDCAQACTACADACLAETGVERLVRCIRLNLDCAAICQATGQVLSRQTETDSELVRMQLEACIEACRLCGAECHDHADHMEHCRVCADACRHCEEACQIIAAML
jgi:hypothetical protein